MTDVNELAARRLGPLEVSTLGFGTMNLAGVYGPVEEAQALETLGYAIDNGVRLIDTADFYGNGLSESLVGKALAAASREGVLVATKTGVRRNAQGEFTFAGSREDLRAACEASLGRLGLERLDVMILSRVDPEVPVEESVGAMGELVAEGKVAHVGLSEVGPGTLRRAHAVHPIAVLQTEYSLWERHVEDELLPLVREIGAGLMAYSPLGRGFLTGGTIGEQDGRRSYPRFQGENLAHNQRLVDRLRELAGDWDMTAAQVALAWVVAQGDGVVPIPGTRSVKHLAANLEAARVELTADQLGALDALFPAGAAAGDRYPAHSMSAIDSN